MRLNTHRTAGLRDDAAGHDWLTIAQLPSYSPDLNPVEGVWSLLRRDPMANTAFTDPDHLTRTLRRGLAHIQRHPGLIDGCLTETGLTLNPGTRSPSAKVSSHPPLWRAALRSESHRVSMWSGSVVVAPMATRIAK